MKRIIPILIATLCLALGYILGQSKSSQNHFQNFQELSFALHNGLVG